MPSSSDSVTVTVLPDVLALVHIPRSRLKSFSHHVVKQILTPGPSFLNITCNKLELSLFADQSILTEFEPLARRDRQRIRRSLSLRQSRARSFRRTDPVEVSYDTWKVLQIDTHDDRLDKAGARVRELSGLLAEAGISILYQSSYMSDYIFVKASRLNQVLSRLAQAGFVAYPFDLSPISPICSPGIDDDECSQLDTNVSDRIMRRRSTDGSLVFQRDEIPIPKSTSPVSETMTVTPTPQCLTFVRRSSISSCAGDVQILEPPLACVGLTDACAETWASKIIKLVAYPELIGSAAATLTYFTKKPDFAQFTDADPLFDNFDPMSPLEEPETNTVFGVPIPRPSHSVSILPGTWPSSISVSDSTSSSAGTSPSSSGEDGYFSSASLYSTSASTPSLSSSRSFPELSDTSSTVSANVHFRQRPRLRRLSTLTGPTSAPPSSVSENPRESAVPFFSFTRTAEGSSLTTALTLIATLFPPSERHMVICSDELGMADGNGADHWRQFQSGMPSPVSSTMKCLQIDLQRFGLDKHGLISRFSKVLDSNGINHMYNSTYKTANLLVDKADALRAQALLRSC